MEPGNMLEIKTLDKEWCDKDLVMLHACFQLLTDCIEEEKLFEFTDWEDSTESKQVKNEIDALYNWWINRVKAEKEEQIDPTVSEDQYEMDTEMLIRLVKLRAYLWT